MTALRFTHRLVSSSRAVLALAAAMFAGLVSMAPASLAAERPNILWITAEDLSPHLGCYGDRYATTPRIDRLAAESIRFTRCFAESPACAPSRFTLITGVHCGPFGPSQMRSRHPIPSSIKGFPSYLRAAGYYCTNREKTDYNCGDERRLIQESWDQSGPKAHWRNRKPGQPFFAVFNCIDTHQSRTSQMPYAAFQKQVQSRLKPEQIHDAEQAPLPPFFPDTPLARRTVARYYDCISRFDDFVGELIDELEADGLAEDTIVVVFSDHGAGMPRSKGAAFASGLRTPLIVRFPEKYRRLAPSEPGTTADRLVCFADFGPTMLNLAGASIPQHMQGRPFLGADLSAAAEFVIGAKDRHDEVAETTRWLNDGRFHYIRSYVTNVPFDQQTLTSRYNGGGFKTMEPDAGQLCREIRRLKAEGKLNALQQQCWGDSRPPEALYDCEQDPWNTRNLAALPEYQDQLRKMRGQLRDWLLDNRDLAFWPEPEMAEAEKRGGIPAELARHDDVYPLQRILETAELAGAGPGKLPELRRSLKAGDASVRYWAAVGLHALGEQARPALDDLKTAIADQAASVRVEAAWAVADFDGSPEALAALANELKSANVSAASRAARALSQLGERARPQRAAIEHALATIESRPGYGFQLSSSIEFALRTAMENLGSDRPAQ